MLFYCGGLYIYLVYRKVRNGINAAQRSDPYVLRENTS